MSDVKDVKDFLKLFNADDVDGLHDEGETPNQLLQKGVFNFFELKGDFDRASGLHYGSAEWSEFEKTGFRGPYETAIPVIIEFDGTRSMEIDVQALLLVDQ